MNIVHHPGSYGRAIIRVGDEGGGKRERVNNQHETIRVIPQEASASADAWMLGKGEERRVEKATDSAPA